MIKYTKTSAKSTNDTIKTTSNQARTYSTRRRDSRVFRQHQRRTLSFSQLILCAYLRPWRTTKQHLVQNDTHAPLSTYVLFFIF